MSSSALVHILNPHYMTQFMVFLIYDQSTEGDTDSFYFVQRCHEIFIYAFLHRAHIIYD